MLGIVAGGEVKVFTSNVVLVMQAQESVNDTAGDVPLNLKATLMSGLFLCPESNFTENIYRLARPWFY